MPQFMREIDVLDIHFIHAYSGHPGALPLITTHGWPASVLALLNAIEPLADLSEHDEIARETFDLVIRSDVGLRPLRGAGSRRLDDGDSVPASPTAWAI